MTAPAYGSPDALGASVGWIQAVLLGPVATALAVIGVAVVGMMMLSGRTNLRRGAVVIIGCFIVFGASSIARGLKGVAESYGATYSSPYSPSLPLNGSPPPSEPPPIYDPYAGAAVNR